MMGKTQHPIMVNQNNVQKSEDPGTGLDLQHCLVPNKQPPLNGQPVQKYNWFDSPMITNQEKSTLKINNFNLTKYTLIIGPVKCPLFVMYFGLWWYKIDIFHNEIKSLIQCWKCDLKFYRHTHMFIKQYIEAPWVWNQWWNGMQADVFDNP